MSKIAQIQALVRNGLYYLTEHAHDEAATDGFDIYDVEQGILTGKTRRTWPKEGKYEVVGLALDGRRSGPIVEKRVTLHRNVRGEYVLIENVPAGVCTQCGTRSYAANVLKTIEESLRGCRQATRQVLVSVYSL